MFFLSSPFLWSSFLLTLRTPFQSASSKSQSGVSLTKKQRPRLGGVLIGIRGGRGVCLPVLQILTLLQTKTSCFSHPFSDLACENCTRFAKPQSEANIQVLFKHFKQYLTQNGLIHLQLKRKIPFVVPLKNTPNFIP